MSNSSDLRFLAGGGEMSERIRAFDWSGTPLGPAESWSPTLRMMISTLLANRFPMLLWWGPQYISLYNDAYIPILGHKHPSRALGIPVRDCWSEIWDTLKPLIDTPFQGGPATWMEDIQLDLNRLGFVEETHFTIAYSPVPDERAPGGIGGVLATVQEITERVIAERHMLALRDLDAGTIGAKSAEEVCRNAASALAAHDKDIPFALLYLVDADKKRARLAGACGVATGGAIAPLTIDLSEPSDADWPLALAQAQRTGALQMVPHLGERFGAALPGAASYRPDSAVVLPVRSNNAREPFGFLVAGISGRVKFDQFHQAFLELLATQISTAIANARAHEEVRSRADTLAEINRAKTAFFANVSHEFRTPLTLILGPIADLLAREEQAPRNRSELELIQRNSQRLLKLVNTLLNFSRVEAGRVHATYEPTDLAALTADLASAFRSATQKAGLRLTVDCPPLPQAVYVDRDMWETIVHNLMSNALKFTFEGDIEVALRERGERVELSVRDTGIGIPDAELPRVFERFHRVRGARSRTHEGSGIGLSLILELIRLHGGEASVQSREGKGTTFTVSLPSGSSHLPAEQIRAVPRPHSTMIAETQAMEEALLMDSTAELETSPAVSPSQNLPRLLIADDNADMRAYLQRLLAKHYQIEVVNDGQAALERAQAQPPDILLSDVMMPRCDGFELLGQLRKDERTRHVPVILLSARAGEEAREEGLGAGADDYLVKPFSARDLLARLRSQLDMSRLRREGEERYRALLNSMNEGYCIIEMIFDEHDKPVDYRFLEVSSSFEQLTGMHGALGKRVREFAPDLERHWLDSLGRVARTGEPVRIANEAKELARWFDVSAYRVGKPGNSKVGVFFNDITERRKTAEAFADLQRRRDESLTEELLVANADIAARKRAEAELRANDWRLRYATESARLTYVEVDLVRGAARTPDNFASVMGYTPPSEQEVDISAGTRLLLQHVIPQDRRLVEASHEEFAAGKAAGTLEYRVLGDDKVQRWIETRWSVEIASDGKPLKSFATNLDITERMNAQEELRASEERYRALLNSMNEGYCIIEMIFDEHDKPVDYRFLEVNPSFEKLTGMRGALGKRIREFAPDIEQHWLEKYGRVARTGEPFRFADEVKGLDRWFDVSAFRVGEPGSSKVGVFFNDITERKRAEIALRESEERYRTLFDSIDEGFCVVEMLFDEQDKPLDYLFVEVNPTFEKQTGLHQAIGKRMRDLVPDIEDHWIEIYGRVAQTGETTRFVNEAKAMDGRWFDVYACRVGGPDSRQVAIVFNDITERRKTAEALADLQRRRDEALNEKLLVATAEIAARRELLRRLAQVEEDERRAIHREMHDRIGQDLASAKLNIDLARANPQDSVATGARLESARNLVQDAINNSRDIMAELRPPGLDEHGLTVALELYAEAVAKHLLIPVVVHAHGLEQRLPHLVETTLFRIVQEAINNLAKHANARKVDISLYEEAREVRLMIADDGSGFDLTRLPEAGRYGFKIMRERAEAVDARLEIEAAPGRGTRITAILERTA